MDASNQGGRPNSLGEFLRDARLAKGMELSDVSASTRVRREYLSALEEGNYEALPEDIYARNFVRLFAQSVGVSGDKALELFGQERRRSSAGPTPGPARRKARIFTSPAAAQPDGDLPEPLRFEPPRDDEPEDDEPEAADIPLGISPPPLRLEPTELQSAVSRPAQPPGSVGVFPAQTPPVPRYTRQQQQANNQRDFTREARQNEARAREGPRSSTLLSSADATRRDRRAPNLGTWLPTLILIAAVVGLGLWAFNTLLFPNRVALPEQPPAAQTEAQPGADPVGPLSAAEAADPARQSVGLTLETDPPGADVSVDGFLLAATTPFGDYAITPGGNRTLRVELAGYTPYEQVLDLSADTSLRLELTPEGQAQAAPGEAGLPDAAASPAPGTAGQVTVRIEDTTWLEAYASTQRGVGERLVYTTVQPGQTIELPLPVYLHVGNAAGVHVWVGDQDRGLMGSSGEVVSRAYTQ